jgi:hypothetical protein
MRCAANRFCCFRVLDFKLLDRGLIAASASGASTMFKNWSNGSGQTSKPPKRATPRKYAPRARVRVGCVMP